MKTTADRIVTAVRGIELSLLFDRDETDPIDMAEDLAVMLVNGMRKRQS